MRAVSSRGALADELVVRAQSVTQTKLTRLVAIRCPFCRQTHTHGWPYADDEAGWRQAHCQLGRGRAYFIDAEAVSK